MVRRNLRVLTLLDRADITGGGERMAVSLTMQLDPSRFERVLCATRSLGGPTFDDELRATGVHVFTLARRSKTDLAAWRPLVEFLRRHRVDVLHAHKFGSNVWGAVLGRLARVPVVVAHEQSWASAAYAFAGPGLRALLDREVIARGADAFIAVSQADRRRMIEFEGIDPRKVRVVYNAVPAPRPTGRDVRRELGIPPDAPVVVTVCQLRAEKALELLVGAAGRLRSEFAELRVLIAGDGPEEPGLREQIGRERLAGTVQLLGTRTDVSDLVAAADVAVCCSDFEGTPLSVMEYMGAGKPVVATRVGGLPEMIEDGVHGLLFERRSVASLADATAALLRDPARRVAMGARGRARQRRDFDLESTTRRVEELYVQLFLQTARARSERQAVTNGWRALASAPGSREG